VTPPRDRRPETPRKARGKQLQTAEANRLPVAAHTGWLLSTTSYMLAVVLVLAVVGFSPNLNVAGARFSTWMRSAFPPKPPHVAQHMNPPLIFGTNMALYDSSDQLLNSMASLQLLKHADVPIIRMPFRSPRGNISEVKALRAIQFIGAIPLVIVHGPTDPNALADDRQLIQLVGNIFGTGLVYVEFGNEPDLAGVDAQGYAASWNAVIPTLKAMAPTYKFIGPSTSTFDPSYLATLDKFANPRPDANSWHEYVCTPNSSDEDCLARLADWTTHILQINNAVSAAIGTAVPLMITEWNLDASVDPRVADQSFMRAWTARALQTLAANTTNGLIGAMQYCVASNEKFNLIDPANSLTPEGQVFFQTLAGITARPVTSR
jgi:hypothetical protein